MQELKETLLDMARKSGVCTDGYGKMLRLSDKGELVDYYLTIPDWCLERNFPDLQTLRDHFSDVTEKGVFVGRTFDGEEFSSRQAYVFHDCNGTIRVAMDIENAIIPMLYIANGCRLRIICDRQEYSGMPIPVPVYVFGDNEVETFGSDCATFRIYKHKLI